LSTRLNQESIQVVTPGVSGGGNVRLNQLTMLIVAPVVLVGQKVQIIGGPIQDALGNPLSNGYLLFQLLHDAVALNTGLILGNISVRVPLDVNGFIQGTVSGNSVFIWPNDLLLPAGGNYVVWAYDSVNRQVWENPQVQRVLSVPSPFNVNAWIPGP
jgi:hypothetical protein